MTIETANAGRLNKALDKAYRFSDGSIKTLRQYIESAPSIELDESDGMINWNRIAFNRMGYKEQAQYEAKLKAQRLYWINGIKVPAMIYQWAKERQARQ